MIHTILGEIDDLETSATIPHLSFSRINRYLHCPEQYRLYYIENLRPRIPSASLVFGKILHRALAFFFNRQGDLLRYFSAGWEEAKQAELNYSRAESWDKLRDRGQILLEKFIEEELSRLGDIKAVEKVFQLNVSTLALPFIGVIDLVADLDKEITVVDFKTSASAYGEYEVTLSDQLTAYQLAEPDAAQSALCVLVKTKEPRIEWHKANRTGQQLIEYLTKAQHIAHEIDQAHFYKRPGKWCSWCDYLPVCVGNTQQVKETLAQIR